MIVYRGVCVSKTQGFNISFKIKCQNQKILYTQIFILLFVIGLVMSLILQL